MEKKTECEIVQDLLLGYVDGVLNEESKKLVEKHLSECDGCKRRLKQIIEDMDKNENDEERKIDYLKTLRRKNKIKSILMAIGIILVICIIIYLYKFLIVSSFMGKAKKSLEKNNFYKETMQIISDNSTSVTKEYYKDGKYKSVWEIYTNDGLENTITEYITEGTDERISINEKEKKVTIEKGEYIKLQNKQLKTVPFINGRQGLWANLGTAFVMSVHTDNYGSNKEYYVLINQFEKTKNWEMRIDKETGLPIKEINKESIKNFFPGTEVVKEIRDSITEYKYEFDIITDKDLEVPDFNGYEVEHKTNEEFDKLLIQ